MFKLANVQYVSNVFETFQTCYTLYTYGKNVKAKLELDRKVNKNFDKLKSCLSLWMFSEIYRFKKKKNL